MRLLFLALLFPVVLSAQTPPAGLYNQDLRDWLAGRPLMVEAAFSAEVYRRCTNDGAPEEKVSQHPLDERTYFDELLEHVASEVLVGRS